MLTAEEKRRMKLAQENISGTNCRGTVLYIFGAQERDRYVGTGESRWESGFVDAFLGKLKRIDTPKKGSVFAFYLRGINEHMGIVVGENPLVVYHRPALNLPVEPSVPLAEVMSQYTDRELRFYKKT